MARSAPPRQYLDFELEIGEGNGRDYPVSCLGPGRLAAREMMRFPFDTLALQNHLLRLENALLRSGGKRRRVLSPHEQEVRDFGRSLFDALLTGEVRALYYESKRVARLERKGLRLRLKFLAPEMASLPWEFLHDPRQDDYLSLDLDTPIVRFMESASGAAEPLDITPPLRILAMTASPTNLDPLDTDRERERLKQALAPLEAAGLVELHWVPGEGWRALQEELHQEEWHVFHFMGHGGYDETADEGFLAFVNETTGQSDTFRASTLARLLRGCYSLRLVVLNSCVGAQGSQRDLFSSSAAALIRANLPAVVAMQYDITDRAAIELTTTFYRSLARGMPVDAALAMARQAISFALAGTVEWGTPVLYLRALDGLLFHMLAGTKEPHNEPAPTASDDVETTTTPSVRSAPEQDELFQDEAARLKAAKTHFDQAESYRTQGEYDQAIAAYTQAIQLDPKYAFAYDNRGISYYNKGEYERAIADYSQAIQLDPKFAFAYNGRGISYRYKGDYDRAIADYSQAIQLDPKFAAAYDNRGISYRYKGDYEQAIADHSQAIQLDPKYAIAYDNRGDSYKAKGDYDRAIADYSQAIQLDPKFALAFYNRALAYRKKGDMASASADFQRAADLGDEDALKELGKL